ncbi:NAD(P)-dependent alcohol dehydrogenase [Nannocystis punicea]|uniref:NAD(P)-dependent alcohol dehydrogenase n=1 Tax=Nannocystis punicea TaxID=2995304 RepID=A0ABY7H5B8_9BACT|nr:NAD(P)-dependent alcohol dehydrogenase [Nannocystis poenicansa]WAS94483.1 NAD(P)-dependent alcohol dehydrogenase [Nannocystis poenicansa]
MAQRSWAQGEPLVLTELPTPAPRRGELVVQVQAIGVNPVDWKMRTRGPLRLAARLLGPRPPVVFGVDFAGVVTAVGEGARVQVGDRVVGGTNFARKQRGSYADTVVVRDDQVAVLPADFDMVVAGALPVAGVTASMCVVEVGRLQAGQRALVLGASGGVGQLAVQFARHVGGSAVGVCSTRNVELVRSLGAAAVIDYTQGDPLVQARAHGPFHLVVDCAGGYPGAACRALLERGGRHVMIANESAGESLNVLVPPFSSKSVLGRPTRGRLEAVVAAVASGAVKVRIEATLPLAQAEQALERSRGGRLTGKLVLLP